MAFAIKPFFSYLSQDKLQTDNTTVCIQLSVTWSLFMQTKIDVDSQIDGIM